MIGICELCLPKRAQWTLADKIGANTCNARPLIDSHRCALVGANETTGSCLGEAIHNQNCSSLHPRMDATVHRNDGNAGCAKLLDQLPHCLVMLFLSPKDVASFQSTCRLLYQMIGLTPLDPPRPGFRLTSHPMGFMTHNQYFRICPFFTLSPANLRRVHSCQVSVAYHTSETCRFRVVACRVPSNADNHRWNPINVAESSDLLPSAFSRTTLTFVPVGRDAATDGSSSVKYYLVACGSQLAVTGVVVRTCLFDNTACAVFNRSSAGGEPLTSELRQQCRTLLSRPIGSRLPVSLQTRFPPSKSRNSFFSEYGNCGHYMRLFRDMRKHVNSLVSGRSNYDEDMHYHGFSYNDVSIDGLSSMLRACRLLRAPRLPCEACAVDTWLTVFHWSLGRVSVMYYALDTIKIFAMSWLDISPAISKYDLSAMETILVAAIDEQHDLLEENNVSGEVWRHHRESWHQLREEAHRSVDDVDQQVSNWCHFEMAAFGMLAVAIGVIAEVGSSLLWSATLKKRG
jgi:hypothetical protein